MTFSRADIAALPTFDPTDVQAPSASALGDERIKIYEGVGCALSEWEQVETAMGRLFQALCESPSLAPRRAYGMISGTHGRYKCLRAAAEEFFRIRDQSDHEAVKAILRVYGEKAGPVRNNIGHGTATGISGKAGEPGHLGYYLVAAEYATNKTGRLGSQESTYFYRAAFIASFAAKCAQLVSCTMKCVLYLEQEYGLPSTGGWPPEYDKAAPTN